MAARRPQAPRPDTSENVELASECLATLLELAPVLTASEQAVLQLQAAQFCAAAQFSRAIP